jgi:Xaa-Pro aminopeptidase
MIIGDIVDSEESIKRRIDAIIKEVDKSGYDAMVFVNEVINQNPSNFIYVSGAWGYGEEHATLVFDPDGGSTVVMPHWAASRMEERGLYDRVIPVKQEKGHHIKRTLEALTDYKPDKVCFDLSTMSAHFAFHLSRAMGVNITPDKDISGHVFKLRAIKDEFEISEMKRAIKITEQALMGLVKSARPGAHTWQIKKKMDAALIEKGAVEFSFDSTLRFVRGSSKPHGIIKSDDMLAVDVGCRVDSGYCSDMGRTWPITMDADVKDYLERMVSAHSESIKNIKPGVTGNEVLEKSSEINLEYGFDPLVRCGHQIGLDCHDYTMPYSPSFGPIETDAQPLKAGMTLTFEPQHKDSKKNMRSHMEDIVLVTENGNVLLNELPWDLLW